MLIRISIFSSKGKVLTDLDFMDTIDISQNIQDFKQVFEKESRIIFSARFGDGKSYFLNEFMKSYDEKKNDYYFITLHPVNYVVEENRDVIEYIKRDILFQLIKDNRIYDFKEGYDKIFDAVCNKESLLKLGDFVASIIPIEGLKDGYEALKDLASTIHEKYKSQDVLHVVDDYLNGFYGKSGSISECDAFTCLIQKSLEQMKAKSVLIIEDLDRIDPAHLFHHFYGKEANYEGYMNKFLNTLPFKFSISQEAKCQVSDRLTQIFGTSDVLKLNGPVDLKTGLNPSDFFSLDSELNKLSVRRCKEFLDDNISTHIKPEWRNNKIGVPTELDLVKLICCLRFFTGFSPNMIFERLMDCLYGEFAIKLFFPLFCICTRRTHIYVKYDNIIFECYYEMENKKFLIEQTNGWNDAKMVDFQKLKDTTRKMKEAILDLIIG